MNGIHDMGGMHGFGPVVREDDEPVFHEEWERRVYGLAGSNPPKKRPTVGMRQAIERMDPARYLATSYYEHWLFALETQMVEGGLITPEELAARTAFYRDIPEASVPRREDPEQAARALARRREPQPLDRPGGSAPRFKVGDRIRARNVHPSGHTRLPRYVRGRRGVVARLYGIHDFPDTNPEGLPNAPQAVYSVRFAGDELWGPSAEPGTEVYLDLWDSYLEPDQETA